MANVTHEGIVTIACSWTFTLLALLSLWAVHLARRRQPDTMRLDDLLVYFAFLCSVVLTSITTWAILREGLYQHLDSVSYGEAELIARVSGSMISSGPLLNRRQSLVANEVMWSLINACFRVAACCFNRRMFAVASTGTVMVVMIVLSVLHFLAALLGGFLICRPVSKSWNPTVQGQCGNEFAAYLSFEIIGLALDMTIILWPLNDIMNLRMPFRRKFGVLIVFSIGLLQVTVALSRTPLNIIQDSDYNRIAREGPYHGGFPRLELFERIPWTFVSTRIVFIRHPMCCACQSIYVQKS